MSPERKRRKGKAPADHGIALILALLALVALSTLAAGIIFVTQTQVWTNSNYRLLTQARYTAEAGLQKALNWFAYSYTAPTTLTSYDTTKLPVQYNSNPVLLSAMDGTTANYPDSTVQSSFHSALHNQNLSGMGVNATYAVTATLLAMQASQPALQIWQVTSQGSIAGLRNAQVQVVATLEKAGVPIFSYAVFATGNGCGSISMSGGATTDSFNSSQGSYSATHQSTGGNVGTDGNVDLSGNKTTVNGTASTPFAGTGNCNNGGGMTALTTNGGAQATGGTVQLAQPITYTTPPPPSPAPPTNSQTISGTCSGVPGCSDNAKKVVTLAPGQYGNLNVTGGTTAHLNAGTYVFNQLALNGNATLVVDSSPVILKIAGNSLGGSAAADLTGGSLSNASGIPNNLQIVYGGSNPVKVTGGSGAYATLYAPNSPVTLTGGADFYGAVVSNTFNDTGGGALHYDRSLPTTSSMPGSFYPTSFSWSKY